MHTCQLQSVSDAIAEGRDGDVAFSDTGKTRLPHIFPTGVCDYSKPDAGRPTR